MTFVIDKIDFFNFNLSWINKIINIFKYLSKKMQYFNIMSECPGIENFEMSIPYDVWGLEMGIKHF